MIHTEVQIKHQVTHDGTVLRVYHGNRGEGIRKHSHAYSHLTMCHAGSILVTKEGKSLVMTPETQPVNLTADEWHEIEVIENETVFVNIYSDGKY